MQLVYSVVVFVFIDAIHLTRNGRFEREQMNHTSHYVEALRVNYTIVYINTHMHGNSRIIDDKFSLQQKHLISNFFLIVI